MAERRIINGWIYEKDQQGNIVPVGPAPSSDSPVITGTPLARNPDVVAREQRQDNLAERSDQRGDITTGIAVRNEGRQQQNDAFSQASQLREKFLTAEPVKNYQMLVRYYGIAAGAADDSAGDQTLINAFAKMQNPDSTVQQGEFDSAAQNDSETNQVITKLKREFGWDGAGRLSPKAREFMLNAMQDIAAKSNKAYNQQRGFYEDLAKRYGFDPLEVVGPHAGAPYTEDVKNARLKLHEDDQQVSLGGEGAGEGPPPGQTLLGYRKGPSGEPYPVYGAPGTSTEDLILTPALQEAQRRSEKYGESDAARVARQGLTLGLSDEVAGVGTAIGRGLRGDFNLADNYRVGRDADALLNDQARSNLGWAGTALEMAGGASGLRSAAGNLAMNAGRNLALNGATNINRAAIQAQMARTVGVESAAAGAIGGFGYGRGAEESLGGAAIGAGLGGALGYGGQQIGNRFANRMPAIGPDQRALAQAGQAEGIVVPNAMMNPRSGNSVARTDATMLGGPRLQAGMQNVADGIENGVTGLGSGNPMLNQAGQVDKVALGQQVGGAVDRSIDRTGRIANAKYQRAEQLAGGAKVTPQESLRRVDGMIARLSETPGTNSNEIAFLSTIKNDLSQDLTVGGLRRMRTALRKKISKGDLVFGEDEANVLSIMDGAADDIRNGLVSQGKGAAARAFDTADKAYRARMEYVSGTLQKMIGKRNANLPPERVADNLLSIARNDAVGLRKFYASLDPSEQGDIAATIANTLGRNAKGDFSLPAFIKETGRMDDRTVRTVFGPKGTESIRNLRLLAREADRVQSVMNSRKSGSGVSMKDVLIGLASGGTPATLAGLNGAGGVGMAATAAAGLGVSATTQMLSARALMSTKLSRWIISAPRTASANAVRAHMARLSSIAKAEPALANDIGIIRSIFANDNTISSVGRSAASGGTDPDSDEQYY